MSTPKEVLDLVYLARNRSAAIRIPTFSESPKAKRIEYRPPVRLRPHPYEFFLYYDC